MNTEVVYTRRGFVKMAAGTVAAAALVAAGAESIDFSKAFAATGTPFPLRTWSWERNTPQA